MRRADYSSIGEVFDTDLNSRWEEGKECVGEREKKKKLGKGRICAVDKIYQLKKFTKTKKFNLFFFFCVFSLFFFFFFLPTTEKSGERLGALLMVSPVPALEITCLACIASHPWLFTSCRPQEQHGDFTEPPRASFDAAMEKVLG